MAKKLYELQPKDEVALNGDLALYMLIVRLTPAYSTSSAYAVGAFCSHDGYIYQCTTAIAAGGEAWTAAHWAQRDLSSLFSSDNPSLATTISTNSTVTGKASLTDIPYGYNSLELEVPTEGVEAYDASGVAYAVGDMVTKNGVGYVCHTAISASSGWTTDCAKFTTYYAKLTDGSVNRISSNLTAGEVYVVELPIPTTGKVSDIMLRVNQPASGDAATIVTIPKALADNLLEMSGDTMEAGSKYERLYSVIPTTSTPTAATCELVMTTRKVGE